MLNDFQLKLRSEAANGFQRAYVDDLQASSSALRDDHMAIHEYGGMIPAEDEDELADHVQECKRLVDRFNDALNRAKVGTDAACEALAFSTELSPRISPVFWLSHLNQDLFDTLHESWQEIIVDYGLALVSFNAPNDCSDYATAPLNWLKS